MRLVLAPTKYCINIYSEYKQISLVRIIFLTNSTKTGEVLLGKNSGKNYKLYFMIEILADFEVKIPQFVLTL